MTTAAERGKKKTKDEVLNAPTTDNTCKLHGRPYITLASQIGHFFTAGHTITWTHTKLKPKKSKCLVLIKAQISKRFRMKVQGENIPSIVDNLIKCPGKWFDESLSDTNLSEEIKPILTSWLKQVNKSGLPGKYNACIYQHRILPRLMQMLLIYEVSMTSDESSERVVNGFVRRQLGVPQSFTSIGLYTNRLNFTCPYHQFLKSSRWSNAE